MPPGRLQNVSWVLRPPPCGRPRALSARTWPRRLPSARSGRCRSFGLRHQELPACTGAMFAMMNVPLHRRLPPPEQAKLTARSQQYARMCAQRPSTPRARAGHTARPYAPGCRRLARGRAGHACAAQCSCAPQQAPSQPVWRRGPLGWPRACSGARRHRPIDGRPAPAAPARPAVEEAFPTTAIAARGRGGHTRRRLPHTRTLRPAPAAWAPSQRYLQRYGGAHMALFTCGRAAPQLARARLGTLPDRRRPPDAAAAPPSTRRPRRAAARHRRPRAWAAR